MFELYFLEYGFVLFLALPGQLAALDELIRDAAHGAHHDGHVAFTFVLRYDTANLLDGCGTAYGSAAEF